jgi:prepilin-type N-terminal cleavage/methylation domain-containing protein
VPTYIYFLKNTKRNGFTLIELLAVVAIIGLLSSIVLVSVNKARLKAKDATIYQNLSQLRNVAELIWHEESDGYTKLCSSGRLSGSGTNYEKPITAIKESISTSGSQDVCYANNSEYCVRANLLTEGYYCVDSTGRGVVTTDNSYCNDYTLECVHSEGACVLAGNKITMADGSYKNVEDIKVGDSVRYYDFETGQIKSTKVIKVNKHQPEDMKEGYYLIINKVLKITPNHPLDKPDSKYIYARDIKVGDKLQGEDGIVEVSSVATIYEKMPTYDLETEAKHYFIEGISDNRGPVKPYQ